MNLTGPQFYNCSRANRCRVCFVCIHEKRNFAMKAPDLLRSTRYRHCWCIDFHSGCTEQKKLPCFQISKHTFLVFFSVYRYRINLDSRSTSDAKNTYEYYGELLFGHGLGLQLGFTVVLSMWYDHALKTLYYLSPGAVIVTRWSLEYFAITIMWLRPINVVVNHVQHEWISTL